MSTLYKTVRAEDGATDTEIFFYTDSFNADVLVVEQLSHRKGDASGKKQLRVEDLHYKNHRWSLNISVLEVRNNRFDVQTIQLTKPEIEVLIDQLTLFHKDMVERAEGHTERVV